MTLPPLPAPYREQFREPAGFMNSAAISPVSKLVRNRVADYVSDFCSATQNLSTLLEEAMSRGRRGLAGLLDVGIPRVGVTHTTGAALLHVAFGLRGGNVVVPEAEFPTNIYPWLRARDAGLIDEVRRVPMADLRLTPDGLRPFVDDSTQVVAVSHVDFATGFRTDLARLREAFPEPLLVVDAIQSPGRLSGGRRIIGCGGGGKPQVDESRIRRGRDDGFRPGHRASGAHPHRMDGRRRSSRLSDAPLPIRPPRRPPAFR